MSTQRGNTQRSRPQKYKNTKAFKNSLHDTSNKIKMINNIQVSGVCVRCKEIIEWKIKYKKYKPLSQPRKCVKCEEKNVKQAYHVMCAECGKKLGVCTKCCESKQVIVNVKPNAQEQLKLDSEMKNLLQTLPERKRRTFLRYLNKQNINNSSDKPKSEKEKRDDLVNKLHALKVEEDEEDDDFNLNNEEDEDFDEYDDFE